MKALIALIPALFLTHAAAAADAPATAPTHRYLIERTFPKGALDGLDAATKQKVNANNAQVGVQWVKSYATADKTKTFCVYEGPSETAVRQAATLNGLPVDNVTEVPAGAEAQTAVSAGEATATGHRYLVERLLPAGHPARPERAPKAHAGAATLLTSYTSADQSKRFAVYEGASEDAVRRAAESGHQPVARVTEVPVTLLPN